MIGVSRRDRTLAPVGYRLGWISSLIIGLLLLYGVGVVGAQQPQEKSLPRFYQVNEHLYRGAQPLPGGMERLAILGIKTVINLRGNDGVPAEETEAQQARLRYFNIPLPGLSAPKDQQVDQILAIINDPKNWPVFVHCNHGKDRTGTIVAVYRITHDGWTGDEAKAEAKRFGLSWVQFGMKSYIAQYREKHKAAPPPRSKLLLTGVG